MYLHSRQFLYIYHYHLLIVFITQENNYVFISPANKICLPSCQQNYSDPSNTSNNYILAHIAIIFPNLATLCLSFLAINDIFRSRNWPFIRSNFHTIISICFTFILNIFIAPAPQFQTISIIFKQIHNECWQRKINLLKYICSQFNLDSALLQKSISLVWIWKKTTKIEPNVNPSQCVTFITSEKCYYAT